MYLIALCILLVLVPVAVQAADLYQIRPLSETDLTRIYTEMMLDACRQAEGEWHASAFDPQNAGYWGDGWTDHNNQGIRAVSCMVFTGAALLRYSDIPKGAERKELQQRVIAGIRYAILTHRTGTEKCVDNKQWGGNWQSAMWACPIGWAAWLLWDDLHTELQKGVESVVSSEADRFLNVRPPSGRWSDTKAEENGWDLSCIALAPNMFPNHPHAAAWREKAIEYMINVLSVGADRKDKRLVDGRPVCDWNCTENLHPDFTLENHDMLHPSYMQCSSYFLTEAAMAYAYARNPVPEAASHHLMDLWRTFQTILLPSGETTYPQGQDWELHGLNPINLFASLGTLKQDPLAAKMERINLQYMRKWQEMAKGSLAVPGSPLGFTRHAIQAEQATWSFLAHKVFGAASTEAAPALPELTKHYTLVDVMMHRSKSKFVSMSWKNHIMGVLVPIGDGHEVNPFFTIPVRNGLIGNINRTAAKDNLTMSLVERTCKYTKSGFETAGVLKTNGGALRQSLKITSIGEKTVVYQDRVTAVGVFGGGTEVGVPVGIENDQISGGTRTVYYNGGQATFDWQKPQRPYPIPGNWANVDGRFGMVAVAGSGIAYVQAPGYNAQGVYADMLCGSYCELQTRQAGDEIAHRVVVLFTEVTSEETAALAKSIKTEEKHGTRILRLALPEGGEAEVELL